ncbi:exocyst complex component, sec8 subunit [Pseudohyphozyma bogoriensis]|nr:exocyst complex component, sec8 subunit [Pseudohyphozyma bogoriensis]
MSSARPPTQRQTTGSYPDVVSPSQSASARFDDGAPRPARPERSVRRPLNTPSPATLQHGIQDGRFPDMHSRSATPVGNGSIGGAPVFRDNGLGASTSSSRGAPLLTVAPPMNRLASSTSTVGESGSSSPRLGGADKSRRMMDNLNIASANSSPSSSPRLTPGGLQRPRRDSASSSGSASSSRPGSPDLEESSVAATAALNTAISAFSSAGARRDGRRGGLADQGFDKIVKKPNATLDPKEYPDTPAFREVEAVLHKVRSDWPVLMYGTAEPGGDGGDGEDSEKDFDPVSLALGLLDPQTVGSNNSLQAFLRMKAELDHAISSTLGSSKSEYRAYESSITTYNATLGSLSASQRQVVDLKKRLGDARERLEGKGREGLAGMYNRMSHLEEMVKILDEIDHLRSIPDRLEALMSDKRFLSAVVLLVRSLKTINKPEMMEIGALTDLRSWLVLQEGVLLEILIEELHNHLYLKSFYCDARWKAYTRGQTTLPLVDWGDDVDVAGPTSLLEASFHTSGRSRARLPQLSKLQRYLNQLSLQPSHNPLLDEPIDDVSMEPTVTDDSSASLYDGFGSFSLPSLEAAEGVKSSGPRLKNAELDSFGYIESLMESLAVLGKLGYGLDAINQRVQSEMFNLVESTVDEVDERNDPKSATNRPPSTIIAAGGPLASLSSLSLSHASTHRSSLLRLTASESTELELSVETLKDLFWTLFSKLDAVLQGFRVSYEVATRIAERRDFKDKSMVKTSSGALLFSLIEVWKPVQAEVRALLHDYLTDDQSGTVSSRNPIVSVNEVLRLARPRDATKQVFKFADSDLKSSSKILKAHEDELNRALKTAVPGLIPEGTTTGGQLIVSSIVTDDRYGGGRSGPGGTHKALVKADAFNVSTLFGPTWAFLERVKTIMPEGLLGDDDAGGFGGFLDDFVLRTFLPQLEEKVTHVFHQAVGGHEAFMEDPNYKKVSSVPIVKSVTNLMMLISSLCSMLRATPFHRESYSHLIVNVIHQFHQRCQERFRDITARDIVDAPPSTGKGHAPAPKSSPLKTSATWADLPEINYCMVELRNIAPEQQDQMREALRRETKIELERKGNAQLPAEDLISPSKKMLALGTLYSSLDWFILHVSSLKTSPDNAPTMGSNSFAFDNPASPYMPQSEGNDDGEGLPLPLSKEMTQPFEALLQSYRQLANLVLFTIRLEIRLRTMHHLDKATREGVYQLAEDIQEPDPSIVDLNSDLAECDECAAITLAEPERRFIFEGTSMLMDQLLISNSRHIRLLNMFGFAKMMRNILALQQNLKNIGESPLDVDFDHSRRFWELFSVGPKGMLEAIRSGSVSYDFEDYKSLLNLMCGIDQSAKDDIGASTDAPPLSAGGDRNRRMYNEYLIDLFALDTGAE